MGPNLFDVLTLNGKINLPFELQSEVSKNLKHTFFKKGSMLLKEGQINDTIWFVQSGLLRGFSTVLDADKVIDITYWFRFEGEFAVSISSFYEQEISSEDIEAYEDTQVSHISWQQLEDLYEKYLPFNYVGRKLLTQYYIESDRQHRGLKKTTAEQRFDWLLDHKPNLLNRVADKYIASYLGIDASTFSRVKSSRWSSKSVPGRFSVEQA
jgi:CRP/FNR family transcriptional regulator, anaerobic regulatory protein